MPSRTLAQDDFSSLGLAAGQDADSQPLETYDGLPPIERAGSVESLKSEAVCEADECYRPVNFIPEEVYMLIKNWESAYLQRHESQVVESMDTESSTDPRSSESIFEPFRCISVSQPPKRFYRTFWRSAARRMLQLDKQNTLQRAAMSSSGASND